MTIYQGKDGVVVEVTGEPEEETTEIGEDVPETESPIDREARAIRYPRIEDDVRDSSGKILTIIDASIIESK